MTVSARLKLLLALWCVGEALAFLAIVGLVGFPAALLAGFLTSLLGWTLLKRAGASAMTKLRATLEGRAADAGSRRFLDDTLATVGALALLLPGFLSDLVGLVLAVPVARDRVCLWIGDRRRPGPRARDGGPKAASPSTIDLDPRDWRRTEAERTPATKP